MIVDTIRNKECYMALHKGFKSAFAFLTENNVEELPEGRYEIEGNAVYAMVQSYTTRDPGENKWETHQKYIDIQYIVKGVETIEWASIDKLVEAVEYSEEKDITFYRETQAGAALNLESGAYAIFFPEDGHKPGCKCGEPSAVKKVVVKIRR